MENCRRKALSIAETDWKKMNLCSLTGEKDLGKLPAPPAKRKLPAADKINSRREKNLFWKNDPEPDLFVFAEPAPEIDKYDFVK